MAAPSIPLVAPRELSRALLHVLALLALACGSRAVRAQQTPPYRFEIATAGDTSFTFLVGRDTTWLKSGMRGIAVDPKRHDALVARFRVTAVDTGVATAIVTGQTTVLSTDHVALVERPPMRVASSPWYRQANFWRGLILGAAAGAVTAIEVRR